MQKETFGQRLTRLRKEKKLTQEDIAQKINISPQAVSKWENDISYPDINSLLVLSDILGVSIDELCGKQKKVEDESNKNKDDKQEKNIDEKNTFSFNLKDDEDETVEGTVMFDDDSVKVNAKLKDGEVEKEFFKDKHVEKVTWSLAGLLETCALVAFIVLGLTWKYNNYGWKYCWLVFFLPIIISSFVSAIKKRQFTRFAYPFAVTFVYLLLGFFGQETGTKGFEFYWFLFITIPVYYSLFGPIDARIRYKSLR
ncbi:MAG: helix-turn-helix domain-containing protein [Bacilli bacterium]|nr:helix-turn-helix domain-containing protein [Bacilli bacterium]MDY6430218.1 helix-turn-helix domain-containing protein [Bacilli bacterium]